MQKKNVCRGGVLVMVERRSGIMFEDVKSWNLLKNIEATFGIRGHGHGRRGRMLGALWFFLG